MTPSRHLLHDKPMKTVLNLIKLAKLGMTGNSYFLAQIKTIITL